MKRDRSSSLLPYLVVFVVVTAFWAFEPGNLDERESEASGFAAILETFEPRTPAFQHTHTQEVVHCQIEAASTNDVTPTRQATRSVRPARTPLISYIGHCSETVDYARKRAEVDRLIDKQTDPEWRHNLLQRVDTKWVVVFPENNIAVGSALDTSSYLSPTYSSGDWRVNEYRQ